MKIKSVRIKNFRGFADQTVTFDDHTSLVGPNGAGKSTVLSALNVFFQEGSSQTEVTVLSADDFHNGNTAEPIEITVTFHELSEKAKADLDHYVRHGELVVSAVASFDLNSRRAPVEQKGERLVYSKFSPWFEAEKNKTLVGPLKEIFSEINHACNVRVSERTTELVGSAVAKGVQRVRPDFHAGTVQARDGMAVLALEFLILTAARTNEVIGAEWAEFDDGMTVWTVPAERMKRRTLRLTECVAHSEIGPPSVPRSPMRSPS